MKAPTNNNPMWIAITVIGGIVAYNMLKKDVVAVADKAADGVKYVADKANPLSQTNVLNSVITATGEAIVGEPWSLGTQTHKWFGKNGDYDWQNPAGTKPKAKPTNEKTTVTTAKNHRGAASSTVTPTSSQPKTASLPARQVNGKWLKLQKGQWLPLTKSDKVFNVRGTNVVNHYLWKP